MPADTSATDRLPIAAIVPARDIDVDRVVGDFVATLRERGVRVGGLLQDMRNSGELSFVCLIDIETGASHPILQCKVSTAKSCGLDTAALAEASSVLRRVAAGGAELVVFNRFSGMESIGQGFAPEMLEFMSQGVPVLAIVQPRHLDAWREFTGGLASELPAEAAALEAWFAKLQD
ncbi:uncharacterized protein DUF2478 [Azonexus fungiphilus]|uniref:Uncharacterized protein DUF2478 n=1 Tax=Azonexus fungiphilus TaxID=146940 RepID=A0A495WGV5_9RHOO|nr:DUF2478 domain-containing protein [Azonexus fungiphilus]RKT60951.1 uncharacterized protein DUF2478 [Azonexus fungiphilus]